MVLYGVFGMFGTMFVACFGRIVWPVNKGSSGMVSGRKLACTGDSKELSGTPGRGSVDRTRTHVYKFMTLSPKDY